MAASVCPSMYGQTFSNHIIYLYINVVDVSLKYDGSEAIDEMQINCSKCLKTITLNRLRYHQFFGTNRK